VRLDDWHRNLEGEFLDDSDEATPVFAGTLAQRSAEVSSAPVITTSEAAPTTDSWITPTSPFASPNPILAANVSGRESLVLKSTTAGMTIAVTSATAFGPQEYAHVES